MWRVGKAVAQGSPSCGITCVLTELCSFEHVAFTLWAYLSFLLTTKLAELRLMLL